MSNAQSCYIFPPEADEAAELLLPSRMAVELALTGWWPSHCRYGLHTCHESALQLLSVSFWTYLGWTEYFEEFEQDPGEQQLSKSHGMSLTVVFLSWCHWNCLQSFGQQIEISTQWLLSSLWGELHIGFWSPLQWFQEAICPSNHILKITVFYNQEVPLAVPNLPSLQRLWVPLSRLRGQK